MGLKIDDSELFPLLFLAGGILILNHYRTMTFFTQCITTSLRIFLGRIQTFITGACHRINHRVLSFVRPGLSPCS